MDNIQNNDVLQEKPELQDDDIQFDYSDMPISKPLLELKKGDTAFVAVALSASVFMSVFGLFSGLAFGYLLSMVLMIVLFCTYLAKDDKFRFLPIMCGVLALANNVIFVCTTNNSVRFFGMVVNFLLSLVCFDGFVNEDQKGNRKTLGVFYSAASTIGNIGVCLKSIFSNSNGDKKSVAKALLGLVCAIPVLIVVVPLLISSDDAFRGMMNNIFSNTFTTILKIIFGVLVSIFVISYGLSLKNGRVLKVKEATFNGIESVYVVSFLSAIGVCYLLYLFSQLAYFFSAFSGFLPSGEVTYAHYARKGFFEMCVIAVINLFIVFLSIFLAEKQKGKVRHSVKVLTTFIAVFTLIIISTAISKMMLYIDVYGMTVLRITTSAFMLFLGVIFIAVILRIYINNINIVKTALIAAGCIVLVLGTVNVNAVCAKYNYQAYQTQKLNTIDIEALYDLGDEGIPYVVKLACSKNDKEVALEAQKYLAEAYLYDYFNDMEYVEDFTIDELKNNQKSKGFDHFNIPKAKAYDELYKFIESNPQFAAKCHTYFEDSKHEYFW